MPGLEDAAHAAATELVEDAVLAELKAAGSAGQQHLGLKAREQAFLDQVAGEHRRLFGVRQLISQCGEFLERHQTALPQPGEERCAVVAASGGHEQSEVVRGFRNYSRHDSVRRIAIEDECGYTRS